MQYVSRPTKQLRLVYISNNDIINRILYDAIASIEPSYPINHEIFIAADSQKLIPGIQDRLSTLPSQHVKIDIRIGQPSPQRKTTLKNFDSYLIKTDTIEHSGMLYSSSNNQIRQIYGDENTTKSLMSHFFQLWDKSHSASDNSNNDESTDTPVPKPQTPSPLCITIKEVRFVADLESTSEHIYFSRVSEGHTQVLDAAAKANDVVGANHPSIKSILSAYIDAIGQKIEALRPVTLGFLGLRLEAELEAYKEDGRDLLFAEQRGAAMALLATHHVFVRLLEEWKEILAEVQEADLSPQDIAALADAADDLAKSLDEHPAEIEDRIGAILRDAAAAVRKMGKKAREGAAVLARMINNVLSALAQYALKFIKECGDEILKHVPQSIAKTLARAASAAILGFGAYAGGSAAGLPNVLQWARPVWEYLKLHAIP